MYRVAVRLASFLFCLRFGDIETRASVIAYEGFQYSSAATVPDANADGKPDLSTQAGGIGFSTAWSEASGSNDLDYIQVGSLGFGSLLVSGNSARAVQPTDVTSELQRNFTLVSGAAGSELWISYLVRRDVGTAATAPAFTLTLGSSTGVGDSIVIGDISTRATLVLAHPGDSVNVGDSGLSPVTGTTYFLVTRISFFAGLDTAQLFVNPSPGAAAPSIAAATQSNYNLVNLDQLRISANSTSRQWSYDEFRVGTTFADVAPVPEPCVGIMLLGSGLWSFIRMRRRLA